MRAENKEEPIILGNSFKIFTLALAILWLTCLFNYGMKMGKEGPRTKVIAPNEVLKTDVKISTIAVKRR